MRKQQRNSQKMLGLYYICIQPLPASSQLLFIVVDAAWLGACPQQEM